MKILKKSLQVTHPSWKFKHVRKGMLDKLANYEQKALFNQRKLHCKPF